MPIHKVCKTIVTSVALASVTLLTVSCSHSGDHATHSTANSTTANAAAATDGNASDRTMDHSASGDKAEHAAHEHENKGVNTNHDIFHSKSIEVPAGTPVPAITVRLEPDAVRGWNLYVGTANFTWTPSDVNEIGRAHV